MERKDVFEFGSLRVAVMKRVGRDRWLYGFIFLYTALSFLVLHLADQWHLSSHSIYVGKWFQAFVVLMPVVAVLFDFCYVILRFDRRRRLAFYRVFSTRRLAALVAGVLLVYSTAAFQGSFTSIKNILPWFYGGFPHDRLHADLDAWLHGGVDPIKLLTVFAQSEIVLMVVEFNYNVLWFIICFGALFFVATSPKCDHIRIRYFVIFFFVWIVCGNILAGLSLSAGPIYYGRVTGDLERFGDALAFLASSKGSNSASSYQEYLWALYEAQTAGLGGGISAFPSVHVALIVMNAFFVWEWSRRFGFLALLYALFIVFSSVYLGWHYAIDGYVSFVVVLICHVIVRAVLARLGTKSATADTLLDDRLPQPLASKA